MNSSYPFPESKHPTLPPSNTKTLIDSSLEMMFFQYVCATRISRCKNFRNKSNMLFLNSKIGEEQSAEDAEDGPPELLVYVGFLMQDEMSHVDWILSLIHVYGK